MTGDEEGRPLPGPATQTNHHPVDRVALHTDSSGADTVQLDAVPDIAAQLLAEVARDSDMLRAAFAAGRALGRQEGEAAADAQWSWAIAGAKLHAERPTHVELTQRRAQVPDRPCGRPGCSSCSVCIRAAWAARHGGDHRGGQVAWPEAAA